MVAENNEKFGNVSIGIHGSELPKFSSNVASKEWWKVQRANKADPRIQSQLML